MIYDELIKEISKDKVLMNENMSKHTSFKVGGMADFFVEVQNVQELIYVLKLAKSLRIKTCIIGNGSNVIVKDTGFRGIIIKLNFKHMKIEKDKIAVGAGVPVALLSEFTYRSGISGYEFLGGIPGTVGGAVKMNAGAYGSEIKDVLLETVILDEIDNGIHDVLMKNIIMSIKDEITGQLIITTHNTLLLEILPKENIYILSTDYNGNKRINSIKEYGIKIQKNNNARDLYFKGVFGGIPTTDYIDFEEIKYALECNEGTADGEET